MERPQDLLDMNWGEGKEKNGVWSGDKKTESILVICMIFGNIHRSSHLWCYFTLPPYDEPMEWISFFLSTKEETEVIPGSLGPRQVMPLSTGSWQWGVVGMWRTRKHDPYLPSMIPIFHIVEILFVYILTFLKLGCILQSYSLCQWGGSCNVVVLAWACMNLS